MRIPKWFCLHENPLSANTADKQSDRLTPPSGTPGQPNATPTSWWQSTVDKFEVGDKGSSESRPACGRSSCASLQLDKKGGCLELHAHGRTCPCTPCGLLLSLWRAQPGMLQLRQPARKEQPQQAKASWGQRKKAKRLLLES